MASIHIDGKTYEVDGAGNLLEACLSLGLDIPYFCWHPALGSVGSCRQCAVKLHKDESDKRGMLVMACMTDAKAALRHGPEHKAWISIEDEDATAFRKQVAEWLMANHPHDCPVCSEGGQCQLQDMIMMTGHGQRAYRFGKRYYTSQNLGPFVAHEMNRCIGCYRCVRYYQDYAGGTDLGVFGSRDRLFFGRETDGVLESEFAGNLTEICPTGVFTDKAYEGQFTRKWDLRYGPGICQGCAVGCAISAGERYGTLRRVENRYNSTINGYFLCDRGRFGTGYVNRKDRPRKIYAAHGSEWHSLQERNGSEAVLADLSTKLAEKIAAERVIAIGSPRASLENNHALERLVGEEHFSSGVPEEELKRLRFMARMLQVAPLPSPTIEEVEQSDAVIIFGEDLTQTAARMALAVRQAARQREVALAQERGVAAWQARAVSGIGQGAKNPVMIASPAATRLDDVALHTAHVSPSNLVALAQRLAQVLVAVGSSKSDAAEAVLSDLEEDEPWVACAVRVLLKAERPVLISGEAMMSLPLLEAVAACAAALHQQGKQQGRLALLPREANGMGVAMMGRMSLDAAWKRVQRGEVDALLVLENDLTRAFSPVQLKQGLAQLEVCIVADHQFTSFAQQADLVLPTASFAEEDGSYVNYEGRVQRSYAVFDPTAMAGEDEIRPFYKWAADIRARQADMPQGCDTACDEEALYNELVVDHPIFAAGRGLSKQCYAPVAGERLARQSPRASGRTAERANLSVWDKGYHQKSGSGLSATMEGYSGTEGGAVHPFAWQPGWNSPQAWIAYQTTPGGPLKGGELGVRLFAKRPKNVLLCGCDEDELLKDSLSEGGVAGSVDHAAFADKDEGEGLEVVPLYHLFGSEELSARSPLFAQRCESPYVLLNEQEAHERFGDDLAEGASLCLSCGTQSLVLPCRFSETLGRGQVGLPVGLGGVPRFWGRQRVSLERVAAPLCEEGRP